MSNFTFFKQWAQYRKSGQLQNPLLALNHRPNNVQELSFLLQITASFSLLHFLPLKTLQSPYNCTLMMTSVDNTLISTKMNQNFIQNLLQLYKQLTHNTNTQSHLQLIRTLFVEILSKMYKKSHYGVKSQKMEYLIFLGVCFDKLAKTKQTKESLESIRRWWTTKKQLSDYLSRQSFELLVLWGYFQQKNQMQWLQDNVSISQKSLDIWMRQLEITLSQQKEITQGIITSLQKQTKQFCTLWQIRSTKSLHNRIKSIKSSILKRYSSYNKSAIFATLFTCLQVFAQEAETAVFLYDDLVQYENVFYGTLLDLQKQDRLYLFPKFHSLMRQHSVLNVLQINYSLTAQLQNISSKRPKQIQQAIQNKDVQMLTQFLVQPIKTSQLILDHYLELSGVKIKQPRDKPNSRLKKFIKMKITDPLFFILIAKGHWTDKFGYQVLGLSLWIITEAYCKQLTQRKQIPQKQLQQYIKKLKVTICVFLLSLKYPTKMLSYLPEEADISNDFIFVPVVPSLLIETGYFFSQFQRDSLKIREKSQINSQADVLPWKYKLFILNNIPSILHNHKGYDFYNIALKYISSINQKQYCEVILKSINAALQGLGLHQMGSEQERQHCLNLLVQEQKLKEMQNLLLRLTKQGDKIGNAANQILKLCSSSSE